MTPYANAPRPPPFRVDPKYSHINENKPMFDLTYGFIFWQAAYRKKLITKPQICVFSKFLSMNSQRKIRKFKTQN